MHTTLQVLHCKLNTCAMAIPSIFGGSAYGHLFFTLTDADYLAMPHTVPVLVPVHPGATPTYPNIVPLTGPMITEGNRAHLQAIKTFETYASTDNALKKIITTGRPLHLPRAAQ